MDFSGVVCLPPSVIAGNGLDGGGAGENDDEPVLVSLSAAPSPQSEAVANELQELSLQPELTLSLHHGRNPNLPPLSERKNGEWYSVLLSHAVCPHQVVVAWGRVLMTGLLFSASYYGFFVGKTDDLEFTKPIYTVQLEGLMLVAVEVPQSSSDKCFVLLFEVNQKQLPCTWW